MQTGDLTILMQYILGRKTKSRIVCLGVKRGWGGARGGFWGRGKEASRFQILAA